MAFGSLSPVASQQFFDQNGDPLAGRHLALFLAGTSTPTPAYADFPLTVPLPNPVVLDAAGRAPALFLDALSYKQVLSDAAGVVIWTVDNIPTPLSLRNATGQSSVGGTQHDLLVPPGVVSLLVFTNTAPLTIDGFGGGTPGQILIVRANNDRVDLVPIYTAGNGSQPNNRLFNFIHSGPTSMVQGGSAIYFYQANGWVMIDHEQGGWIRVPYNAANFTATAGAAWVVEPADYLQFDYKVMGTSCLVTAAILTTSITGTAPLQLYLSGLPYTWRVTASYLPATIVDAGAVWQTGMTGLIKDSAAITIMRAAFATWTPTTNGAYVFFQSMGDVN